MKSELSKPGWLVFAVLVCLFGLESVYTGLRELTSLILGGSVSRHTIFEWFHGNGVAPEYLFGGTLFAVGVLLILFFRRVGVADEAVPLGRISIGVFVLIVFGIYIDFEVSKLVYFFFWIGSSGAELEIYRPEYEQTYSAGLLLAFALAAIIAAPLTEEVMFRGLLFGTLTARGAPVWIAVLISAVLFAWTHQQYTSVGQFMVLVSGLFFGALRVYTGGLLAPILAHSLFNATVTYLNFF